MIKLQEMTPEILYDQSRDFQFIGRLFDLVLNSVKTEADLLLNIPFSDNSSDELLSLLTLMFGLSLDKNKYTNKQLRAICSVTPILFKNKGSIMAVEILCRALMRADAVVGEIMIIGPGSVLNSTPCHIDIYLPSKELHQEILLELLPYIVPAGVTFTIKQANSDFERVSDRVVMSSSIGILRPDRVSSPDPCTISTLEDHDKQGLFEHTNDGLRVLPGRLMSADLATPVKEEKI